MTTTTKSTTIEINNSITNKSTNINNNNNNNKIYDVIIVGGGLSGLKTAYNLKKLNFSVLVLEARNRFGGRTETIKIDDDDDFNGNKNGWIDLGGQWLGSSNKNLRNLCKELKLETYLQYYDGKTIFQNDKNKPLIFYNESDFFNQYKSMGLDGIEELFKKLDKLNESIDFGFMKNNDQSLIKSLEIHSVDKWLNLNGYQHLSQFFSWFTQMSVASNSKDISLLFLLKYIKSVSTFTSTFISSSDNDECSEYDRVVGGSETISNSMVESIGFTNCILNCNVISIDQQSNLNGLVEIKSKCGKLYTCKKAVITISQSAVLNSVVFKPELPMEKKRISKEMRMAYTIKIIIVYNDFFWRNQGLNGKSISYEGPLSETFDNSTNDGSVKSLVGFVVGKSSVDKFLSHSEFHRKQLVLSQLESFFGPLALTPKLYIEKNWSDEIYTGGCYLGVTKPGNLLSTSSEYYQKPINNIHWAGTETSDQYYGHMEGAIVSANRVSEEISLSLKVNSKL